MNQESLFLPFDEGGRSIGLPLCYRLVKSMGGVLSLVQEKGSVTFTVSLPKQQMPSHLPQDEQDVVE
jgi:signal transduction histidine kinase